LTACPLLLGGAGNQPIPNFVRSSMKKFKSLMLAALASAALAAPSFADGHAMSMSGDCCRHEIYDSNA